MSLLTLSLVGCSASTAVSSSPDATAEAISVIGRVIQIDGSDITLEVGAFNTLSDQQNGAPPTMPQNGTPPPEAPSGALSELPSSQPAPDGNRVPPDGFPDFTVTDEVKTITITASTAITHDKPDDGTAGSTSDIEIGDIIVVTMQDTTVTTVTILGHIEKP